VQQQQREKEAKKLFHVDGRVSAEEEDDDDVEKKKKRRGMMIAIKDR